MTTTQTDRLIAWINDHDCGVTPTAVLVADGQIDIRVGTVDRDGTQGVDVTRVANYSQARDALGY